MDDGKFDHAIYFYRELQRRLTSTTNSSTSTAIIVVVTIVLFLVLVFLWIALKRVSHAEVMIIERWGKYNRTLKAGMHVVWPIVEHARKIHWRTRIGDDVKSYQTDRIDLREHVHKYEPHKVITKDTVQVDIDVLVYFRITDPRFAVFKIQQLPDAIAFLTQATLRNIIANMTLEDTFSARDQINSELLALVRPDVERWGVIVTRVEIFSITPPVDIKRAMELQIRAERERRSEVLEADGTREKMIIESRGDAAQVVLKAEGERTSNILRAKGDAEAKLLEARAEAQSIEAIKAALVEKNIRAVDYLTTVQYLDRLQELTRQQNQSKVVLIPSENIKATDNIMFTNLLKR